MPAEGNKSLSFSEPYLLAMSANRNGQTGCQFFITLDALPPLDGSDHTIIGRLLKGKETLTYMEGVQQYENAKPEIKRRLQSMPMALGVEMNPMKKEKERQEQEQAKQAKAAALAQV